MKTSELIDKTIEIIQVGGWMRDSYGDLDNPFVPHCVSGAWYTNNPNKAIPNYLFLKAVGMSSVVNWNDFYAADRHEVVATLLTMYNLAIKAGD